LIWKLFRKKQYDFYIAGPMRGYDQLNHQTFSMFSCLLRDAGYTVWSPHEHGTYLSSSFFDCIRKDLNAVMNLCEKIVLLPGWRHSIGSNFETFMAFAMNKEAFEIRVDENNENEFVLEPVDLSTYRLPYGDEHIQTTNPHRCAIHSKDRIE